MMKFREVPEAEWTNYYIECPGMKLPYYSTTSPDEISGWSEVDVMILGRPGKVVMTADLDLLLGDVESISFMKGTEFLGKKEYLDYPPPLKLEEIISWIVKNLDTIPSKRLKNREA